MREAFKETLEYFGYEVIDAADGLQALELFRRQSDRVRLIVSDLIMPHMNALQLYVAAQELQDDVRMLIVTGYPMPHAGESLVKEPNVSWTSKPVDMDRLDNLVRATLEDKPVR